MNISELLSAVAQDGIGVAALAIGLYILLRGEVIFRYPARGKNRDD